MGPMWIKLVVQSPIERGAVSDTKIEAQLVKSPTVSGHLTQSLDGHMMPRRAFRQRLVGKKLGEKLL